MRPEKTQYLKQLTANLKMRSAAVGKELEGSTPPSVFIGSWNYPKVFAGPMMAPVHGDTWHWDTPETWIPNEMSQEEILGYRMNLVRGKCEVRVSDMGNPLVDKLQEISLSSGSIDSEASFSEIPKGMSLNEEHAPYGPSGVLKDFEIGNSKWDQDMEHAHYDTDLKAAEAVVDLHKKGVAFSSMQKAFSTGAFGAAKNRKIVPTRWSITACDTILGNNLLKTVKHNNVLDCYKTYEFSSLNNHYAVILTPTPWQYEWTEAFLHVMGNEEMVFSDCENNLGKKGYSSVGGCYYSCKMAVLEALEKQNKQAGAIVLREAYEGYIPLGVFNVRENVRSALRQAPKEFPTLKEAMSNLSPRFRLPMSRFAKEGKILNDLIGMRQRTLDSYFAAGVGG